MMSLESIRRSQINIIPVSYEYDGFLVLTDINECDENLRKFNQQLQVLLQEAELFPMNFEHKDL